MSTYGQFCPVAMAAEVITERWTPLILRELLAGSSRFNDLRRGVPLMSPSLLTKRLRTLERVGVIQRVDGEYQLTEAGEELRPVIQTLGEWGARWARGDVTSKHHDAGLLMWDIRRNVDVSRLPACRVVVHFHVKGSTDRRSHFWLVLSEGEVDLCTTDPGYPVDIEVSGHVAVLVDYWRGVTDLADAMRSGDLVVEGPSSLVRAFPTWFLRSPFASVPAAQ